jgi:hypothetical protein
VVIERSYAVGHNKTEKSCSAWMFGLAWALMATSSFSPALAEDQRLAKTTRADHDVVILGYGRSNQNCESIDPPALYLEKPPDHGTVCFRTNDITINKAIVGNLTHCIGRKIHGVVVVYSPGWKYAGPDDVRYTVIFPKARHGVYVELTVLPDRPSSSGAVSMDLDAPTTGSPQLPGPIPACASLVS